MAPRVGQGAGKSVELGDHQRAPRPACGESFAESRTLSVGTGQAVVNADPLSLDAETEQGVTLRGQILLIGGTSGVPDEQRAHGAPPKGWPGRTAGRGRLGVSSQARPHQRQPYLVAAQVPRPTTSPAPFFVIRF